MISSLHQVLLDTGRFYSILEGKKLLSNYKNIAGIYCLFNQQEDKVYVGSGRDLSRRVKDHLYPNAKQTNRFLRQAIQRHGLESFHLVLLEILGPSENVTSAYIFEREDFYLQKWPREQLYNIYSRAGSALGHTLTEEQKIKRMGTGFFGRKHTPETKNKLSQLHKQSGNPMYGKEKSPEFLAWMGLSRKGPINYMYGRGLSLSVWTTDGSLVGDFPTLKQAVATLCFAKETIKRHFMEHRPYYPKGSLVGYWFLKPLPTRVLK